MNKTSRSAAKERQESSRSKNKASEDTKMNAPPRKAKSQRRNTVDKRPTDAKTNTADTTNKKTAASLDPSETLQRMSGGKEKEQSLVNAHHRRSNSVPGTGKEEKQVTSKSSSTKPTSSRDLKKHKSSRRHSTPSDGTKVDTPLSREPSSRGRKHQKSRNEGETPDANETTARTSKAQPKSRSPKRASEKDIKPKSSQRNVIVESATKDSPERQSTLDRDLVKKARKSRRNVKEGSNSDLSKKSTASDGKRGDKRKALLSSDKKKPSVIMEDEATDKPRVKEQSKGNSRRSISSDPSMKRSKSSRPSTDSHVRSKSSDGSDYRKRGRDEKPRTPKADPRDDVNKGSRRSVSSDPSMKRSKSARPSSESRVRSKSSDGIDRRMNKRRVQSEAAFQKRREARVAARTVNAATAKEIEKRREDLLSQREDEWVVQAGGANITLEFASDDIGNIEDKDLEEFDEERSHSVEPIDFLKDNPADMTYGRRIALRLMKYKWYNPKAIAVSQVEESSEKEGDDSDDDLSDISDNGMKEKTSKPTTDPVSVATIEAVPIREERPSLVTKLQFPSLARAWAYFEHVTLPRYVVEAKPDAPKKTLCVRMIRKCFCKANKKLDRAEPGENLIATKLYSPIFTPLSQMGDFGLGIGLYFSTLRGLTIMMLLAGLINIPNFLYFGGNAYSSGQPGVLPFLKGSAICTNQVWVPCPNCTTSQFEDDLDRLGSSSTENFIAENGEGEKVTFALLNDCDGATFQQGMVNYGTLIFVLLGIVAMNIYQKHMEVKYDEDEQTAQDYSIVIQNPPPDATDPEEWRLFMRYNFRGLHTTACTIAVDNDLLVRCLVKRRECMRKIEMKVEPGTSLDTVNLARIAMEIERKRTLFGRLFAVLVPGIPELFGQVTVLTAKVQGLAQQDYPATHVFLTFETEAAQRQVLSTLSVGTRATDKNNTEVMKDHPTYLFRGNTLLRVEEPDEPSTVRWQDLNTKWLSKFKQIAMTTLATIAAISVIALLIWKLHGVSPFWAAMAIAAANGIFPQLAKLMTMTESHASESGKQTSLYFKIAFFRWVNTAIIITIITPFTKTLDNEDGLIRSIGAIFFADIVTTNAVQLLDPVGHLQRHFLAPRATTQDLMNINMRGFEFELAERYTNMTKILFLALYYCAIFPGALFLCSFALLVNFFMDRFSLMRTWKRAPALGTTISKFSRKYFFTTAIIAMAIVASYSWASFRFDNLCETDDKDPVYNNRSSWNITTLGSGINYAGTTVDSSVLYKYCLQDMLRQPGKSFPAIPSNQPEGSEWMTEEQEDVTRIYGWTSVAVLGVVFVSVIWGWIQSAKALFKSTYEPSGEDQGINFSEVPSISTYVPQVESKSYSYPLFACNVDSIDADLFDWTDPDRPHGYYDLTKDAEELLEGTEITAKMVFSTLSHWPPEGKKKRGSTRSLGSVGSARSGSLNSIGGSV